MGHSNVHFLVLFSWIFLISSTYQLQPTQTQLLLQVRKHLEYPIQLSSWENYTGDFCYMASTLHVTITCQENSVSELKIMGDKLSKVSDFHGFAVPNQTLSGTFSVDSLITTLTRLTSLRVLSLVSLGIWGPLPEKIHRLNSLEFLDMSSNFIFGSIPPQISRLVKLHTLILDGNFFNESIPDVFDPLSNLTILSLKNNKLKGVFPSSVCRIKTLTDISFSSNEISGKLPDLSSLNSLHLLDLRENHFDSELPLMPKGLTTLLLSNNSFSGKIPDGLGKLNQLQHLDLSFNDLEGEPPSALFTLPNISYLNLASNLLKGSLANDLKCGDELGFVDISSNRLTGNLPSCLDSNSDKRLVKFGGNCFSIVTQYQHRESYCKEANIKGKGRSFWVIIGIIGGILAFIIFVALVLYVCRRRYRPREAFVQHMLPKVTQENSTPGISPEVLANARIISEAVKLGTQGAPACRVFSVEDLADATNDFDKSTLLGEGSIGKLYKGRLENGSYIAIRSLSFFKKYSIRNLKIRLELLSKLRHPHLVGLLGYCIDGGPEELTASRVFLVYEYISNGNFHDHLSENSPEKVLKWSDRLAVLIGVAKAVHFLHTGVIPASFNKRLKTNNILFDEHQIAKLSDYGMTIITDDIEQLETKGDGPKSWSVSTLTIVGAYAPSISTVNRNEVLPPPRTKVLSFLLFTRRHMTNLGDDVYNFGFILLETLVGPIVSGKGETFLLNEMKSFGSQDGRQKIVDPIVLMTCCQESLSIVISITNKCISPEPASRPSFEDVLWNLQYAAQVQATSDSDQKSDAPSQS